MGFFRRRMMILLLLLIGAVAFLSVYSHNKQQTERGVLHETVLRLAAPLQMGLAAVIDGSRSIWSDYLYLVDAAEEANTLRELNSGLARRLSEMEEVDAENARLRRLLGFARREPFHYAPARIIAADILGQFRTVTLNVGQKDGVTVGAPVLNADGVVGRVVESFPGASRVLLIIDPNSAIDGFVRRTEARGIIQGTNDNDFFHCQFAFSLKTEDVRVGDLVVTSGLDQQFPSGLPMGIVFEVTSSELGIFQEAKIKPLADFTRLREVLVMTSTFTVPNALDLPPSGLSKPMPNTPKP